MLTSDGSARILIVSENPVLCGLLETALSHAGHAPEIATDGESVVDRLAQAGDPPDVLLLDLGLTRLSSLDVIRLVRTRRDVSQLPVLALAAPRDARTADEALELGANDCLSKPIQRERLLERVRTLVVVKRAASWTSLGPGGFAPIDALPEGTIIAGRYRLHGTIGTGACGVVYDGEHMDGRGEVALKVLLLTAADPQVLARFQREVIASRLMSHPNTVKVLDFGITQGVHPFVVMERLRGRTLEQHVRAEGPLTVAEVANLMAPICRVLGLAHDSGIVHRDVKPANIFLSREADGSETPKLLDFGIAKLVQHSTLADATSMGSWIGTPRYMAPERFRQSPTHAALDIYALGVTLYELMSGQAPVELEGSDPVAWANALSSATPAPLTELCDGIDGEVAGLIAACLAKHAHHRPVAEEVGRVLEQAAQRACDPGRSYMPYREAVDAMEKKTRLFSASSDLSGP